ncbi:MAG: CDP-glycerol:glycerophosphate glycerophosphotransferase [bacterium]|nr:CDP-glycerol:glycerophosphate glycerophosphotransferase [bacterium]
MKISIVICISRSGQFLKDCLNSLAEEENKQYRMEIEIILVEDHIEQYIKELTPLKELIEDRKNDLSIKEVKLHGRTGVAAARNYGISKAMGDYLLFLDDDDYLERGALRSYFSAIEGRQQVIAFQMKRVRVGRDTYFGQKDKEGHVVSKAMVTEKASPKENAAEALIREKERLRHISVLNLLFRRTFLERNQLIFDESLVFYSDLPFVSKVVTKLSSFQRVESCTYCKRIHNDPIQFPSLSQIQSECRFDDYIRAYKEARTVAEGQPHHPYLEQLFQEYVVERYVPRIRNEQKEERYQYKFTCIKELLSEMSAPVEPSMHGYKKRVLRAIKNGNKKKAIRITRRRRIAKKCMEMIHKRSTCCKELYLHLFYRCKVKPNYVMFESFLGRGYSDSPKYVYEYLAEKYAGCYKCIWVFRDTKKKLPFKAVKVKRFGLRYAYYLAVSKYFVYNMRQPVFMHVKDEQIFCETWHGIPMKRIMFDQEEVTGPDKNYKKTAYKQSRQWNYLVSPNAYCTSIFKRCFLFENKILETGYPRNDILHIETVEKGKKIRDVLGIPENKKVVLYAPTFRDNEYYGLGEYKYECALDFQKLRDALGKEYVLLLRTHYLIADSMDLSELNDFVINVSKYEDINELYLISDVLISDYSSVAFDFANLKRPMIFYMYDLEQYRDQLRGFYIDIEKELPGPIVTTTEELIRAIQNVEEVAIQFQEAYQKFYDKYCYLEDGQSTKRLVEELFSCNKG